MSTIVTVYITLTQGLPRKKISGEEGGIKTLVNGV